MNRVRGGEPVAVTGIGIVSPFGVGRGVFYEGLSSGRSAIREVKGYKNGGARIARFAPLVGFVDDELVAAALRARGISLSFPESWFAAAILAAGEAVDAATVRGRELPLARTAVSVGSAFCQLGMLEGWVREGRFPAGLRGAEIEAYCAEALPAMLAERFGLRGPRRLFSVACASANFAIGSAIDMIRAGEAEAVLCGGMEGFQESSLVGASHLGVIDPQPCRPFAGGRAGFNPGIGAAFLILESLESAAQREVRTIAEIVGFGSSSDACHLTAPDMDGEGMSRAIAAALEDAGIGPRAVSYINAHGTGTYINDLVETRAVKRVFGEHACRVPVSSTKSQIGHCAGASAAMEAVACCFAVSHDRLPPTVNYLQPDPECDLDYVPNAGRDEEVQVAASNSFAFGGHNSCLLVAKPGAGGHST